MNSLICGRSRRHFCSFLFSQLFDIWQSAPPTQNPLKQKWIWFLTYFILFYFLIYRYILYESSLFLVCCRSEFMRTNWARVFHFRVSFRPSDGRRMHFHLKKSTSHGYKNTATHWKTRNDGWRNNVNRKKRKCFLLGEKKRVGRGKRQSAHDGRDYD